MIATIEGRRFKDDPMAKKGLNREDPKKGAPRINPSELRIQALRVSEIQNAVDDARDFIAAIEAILEQCREKKVETCVIDGATKAIAEARRSRGAQDHTSES